MYQRQSEKVESITHQQPAAVRHYPLPLISAMSELVQGDDGVRLGLTR